VVMVVMWTLWSVVLAAIGAKVFAARSVAGAVAKEG